MAVVAVASFGCESGTTKPKSEPKTIVIPKKAGASSVISKKAGASSEVYKNWKSRRPASIRAVE